MNVLFLEAAEVEFGDAIEYYNQQREGLGYDFALEVEKTFERIIQFPDAWPLISPRTRRCRMNKFPYGILYQMREDAILILAVMHLSRHPDSWKARLQDAG